jgi:beta-lactamase class A
MLKTLILCCGSFILGCLLVYGVLREPDSKKAKPEISDTVNTAQSTINNTFTNPYLSSNSARNLYWKPINSFKESISEYMEQTEAKYPNIQLSYYFRDLTNGQCISVGDSIRYSPASVMKLPIMMAIFRRLETDPDFLSRKIRYSNELWGNVVNPDCAPLTEGKLYSIESLLERMIQQSDNVSTFILLDEIDIKSVKAIEAQMDLNFQVESNSPEDQLTISQCATFFRVLYNSTGLKKKNSERALKLLTGSTYKRGIRKAIPANIPFAQKYGIRTGKTLLPNGEFEYRQLHQLGIVYHPSKPFIISVMIKYHDRELMDKIMYDLGKMTWDAIQENVPENYSITIAEDLQ